MKGWKLWAVIAAGVAAIWWYLKRQQQAPANIAKPAPQGQGGAGYQNPTNPLDLIKQLGQSVLSGAVRQIPVTSKASPIAAQLQAGMMSQLDINKMADQVGSAIKNLFSRGSKENAPFVGDGLGVVSRVSDNQFIAMNEEYYGLSGIDWWNDPFNRQSFNPTGYEPAYTQPVWDPFLGTSEWSGLDADSSSWLDTQLESDAWEVGLTADEWSNYFFN